MPAPSRRSRAKVGRHRLRSAAVRVAGSAAFRTRVAPSRFIGGSISMIRLIRDSHLRGAAVGVKNGVRSGSQLRPVLRCGGLARGRPGGRGFDADRWLDLSASCCREAARPRPGGGWDLRSAFNLGLPHVSCETARRPSRRACRWDSASRQPTVMFGPILGLPSP